MKFMLLAEKVHVPATREYSMSRSLWKRSWRSGLILSVDRIHSPVYIRELYGEFGGTMPNVFSSSTGGFII